MGNAVRRLVPRAGLLGSLAAIALALIAFLPLLLDGIAAVPLVGMLALMVILLTLVAHRDLPGKFPGALAAVLVGVALYWLLAWAGPASGVQLVPPPEPPLTRGLGTGRPDLLLRRVGGLVGAGVRGRRWPSCRWCCRSPWPRSSAASTAPRAPPRPATTTTRGPSC